MSFLFSITFWVLAYCIYQMLVPRITKKRQALLLKEREERNMKLRALYILQHFKKQEVAEGSEHAESNALHFARLWKSAALHRAKDTMGSLNADETEPLIPVESNNDDDEDGIEDDPREHFAKNLLKALALMLGGTAVVALFSDPMVNVITELGRLWNIPVFYISFVLTPFCSNASELVASLAFAAKKKVANTSMTYSQLYGATIMNNTMGLGIFYGLIAFRGLDWQYSSETLAILFVVLAVGIPGSIKKDFQLYWIFLNAPLYFLSLVLVFVLDNYAGWK